jgi:hypothetical protein
MIPFVDLQREFRELSRREFEHPDLLASPYDRDPSKREGWAEVLRYPRVLLLAEAGSGKTREMREQVGRLNAEGKYAFFVELERLRDENDRGMPWLEESPSFLKWRADRHAPGWLFLDAVDELKLTQGNLERALSRVARALKGLLDRVHVVMSCRPTDWRPESDLATFLGRLPITPPTSWALRDEIFLASLSSHDGSRFARKDVHAVVLVPLSHHQIEMFSRALGVPDPRVFLEEILAEDAVPFADRPFDCLQLAQTWIASGRLGSCSDQHESSVTLGLKEDPERAERGTPLSDTRARQGAERLAFALPLTRTLTIRAPEQVLDIDRAGGVLDCAQILPDWSEGERKALLRRPIFDPATYGRVRFHHRSIQEYLAACHLKQLRAEGMPAPKLSRFLFAERYGVAVVIPSMRCIAAWLALWDEDVQRELIKREPEALLSLGDPERLPLDVRAKALRAYATACEEGASGGLVLTHRQVRRVAHPQLTSVIRELWGKGLRNNEVRKLMLDLVEQGSIRERVDVAGVELADGPARTAPADLRAAPQHDHTIGLSRRQHRQGALGKSASPLRVWVAWRRALLADPAAAFAARMRGRTLARLHQWLSVNRASQMMYRIDVVSVWDEDELKRAFGPDIAQRAAEAFRKLWRACKPALWSVRPAAQRKRIPAIWLRGLCGLASEASAPGWARKLRPLEIRAAVAYATLERQFPSWFFDLLTAHPGEVALICGEELVAELAMGDKHALLPMWICLSRAELTVKQLFAPLLLELVRRWRTVTTKAASADLMRDHLMRVIEILQAAVSGHDRQVLAEECERRFAADPGGPFGLAWLRSLFYFDPNRASQLLDSGLGAIGGEQRIARMAAFLIDVRNTFEAGLLRAEHASTRVVTLGRLIRCAFRYAPPVTEPEFEGIYADEDSDGGDLEDDDVDEGLHQLDDMSSHLLALLGDTPGHEAYRLLLDFAADPLFSHCPEQMRLLARERAAKDAEFEPFRAQEVVNIQTSYEAPRHDRDGMFDIMVDRLRDLTHEIVHHDFGVRDTLRTIKDENAMQRQLARRLQDMSRNMYVVTREGEVADKNKTDIRLEAVRGEQKAVIEVKLAGKWSISALERALQNQLVGRYLRHESSRVGCLLLVYDGSRKYWPRSKVGAKLTFQKVVQHLARQAKAIERRAEYQIRLIVWDLDLSGPTPTPVRQRVPRASARR